MTNGMLYYVSTEEGQYVMTAPMHVLVTYLRLHPDAVRRIERETVEMGAKCKLYADGYVQKVYVVERLEAAIPQENPHAKG